MPSPLSFILIPYINTVESPRPLPMPPSLIRKFDVGGVENKQKVTDEARGSVKENKDYDPVW